MPISKAIFVRWVEFELKINHIMVDLCLSSFVPPPPPSPCRHFNNLPRTHIKRQAPLLSFEGCGPNQLTLAHLRSEDALGATLPFSKGMWASPCILKRIMGEGETRGGTQGVGGPLSVSQTWTMTFVMVCFPISLPYFPPLTAPITNNSIPNDWMMPWLPNPIFATEVTAMWLP